MHNYGDQATAAAHVVGYRDIMLGDYTNIQNRTNNIGGIVNEHNREDSGLLRGTTTDNRSFIGTFSNSVQISNVEREPDGVFEESISRYLQKDFRSEIKRSQNRSLDTRSLLVVAVRGSVSWADWGMDLGTQFTNIQLPTFTDGSNAIYQTLYGTGEANDCPECHGASGGCVHCMGYITYHNLINPIILITGHSLGAAIVNITATRLNNDVVRPNNEVLQWDDDQQGAENIFAYAFATPNTVEVSENNHAIHYTNIFNILNNNDIVTFVPKWSTDVLFGSTNWQRNGKDYRVTMPFSVSIPVIRLFDFNRTGLIGHAMSNYLSWLEQLPGKLNKTPEEISKTDLGNLTDDSSAYGLLPKMLKIACPVSVTIEDENGNTLAFESEQANVVYPQISAGSEIVSWITQDSEKVFLIPYGQEDVTAEIHAYDEGVMTLSVGTIGIEGSPDEKTFNDVILYDGKDFETSISVDSPIEDTQLLITENGNTVGEVTETNPLLHSVSTNCVHTNNGIDSIITIVTDKTVSKVQFRNV